MAILFTLRVFTRNLLRGNRRRNTRTLAFRLVSQQTTYQTTATSTANNAWRIFQRGPRNRWRSYVRDRWQV